MPLAVPTLVGMGERVADGFGQPEAGRQAGSHLAVARQAAPLRPRIGQRPHDPADPAVQRKILGQVSARSSACPRRAEPSTIGAIVRVERDVVAARQHRRLRRIRRAAHEAQQRHVVHARSRRRVQARAARRPPATASTSATPAPSADRCPRSVANDNAIVSSANRPDPPCRSPWTSIAAAPNHGQRKSSRDPTQPVQCRSAPIWSSWQPVFVV